MPRSATEVCSGALRPRLLRLPLLLTAAAAAAQQDAPRLPSAASGVAAAPEAAERRLSWGSFTAETSNPTMAPVAEVQDVPASSMSDRSSEVVAGIVETFLHKMQLQPGELDCLKEGTGKLAGEFTSASQNAMTLVQQVLGGHTGMADDDDGSQGGQPQQPQPRINDGAGSISAMVDSMQAEEENDGSDSAPQAPPPPPPTAPPPSPQQQQANKQASNSLAMFYGNRRLQMAAMAMSAPMLFMNLGYSVHHIADLTKDVVKECVKGDARQAFQIAGKHMQSLRYVEGKLVANGADIVTELADALQNYEKHNYKSFGHDMGRVLRKVLLSKNANGLPEGLPGKLVIANITAGVMRGFFGEGFALNLQTQPGYDPLHIDLHQCVGSNLAFFQSLWGATMLFYGKKDARGQHSVSSSEKPNFGATLALTVMQLPSALRKCNIGEEQEHMLMDSIKRLGSGMKYNLDLPKTDTADEDKIANDMATTVKDWARTDYYTFGQHLGYLLQEMFVDVYGQKWSVDHRGTLRKRLVGMAAAEQRPLAGASARSFLRSSALKLASVAVVPLLAGLVVLRIRHSIMSRGFSRDFSEDPEAPVYGDFEGVE